MRPGTGQAAAEWPALSAAVGLLTARLGGPGQAAAPAEFLLADHDTADVLDVTLTIASALLAAAMPGERGELLLRRLGLLAVSGMAFTEDVRPA